MSIGRVEFSGNPESANSGQWGTYEQIEIASPVGRRQYAREYQGGAPHIKIISKIPTPHSHRTHNAGRRAARRCRRRAAAAVRPP